jgi:hypothetical protein
MLTTKRKSSETRTEKVRRQFRENAARQNPSPFVQTFDAHGRPRKSPRHTNVKA